MPNIRLQFDNVQDHYVIGNNPFCNKTNCTIGFWENELNHLRYYCKWCLKTKNCDTIQQNNCFISNVTNNQKITNTMSNIEIKSPNVMIQSFQPKFSTFDSETTMNT